MLNCIKVPFLIASVLLNKVNVFPPSLRWALVLEGHRAEMFFEINDGLICAK